MLIKDASVNIIYPIVLPERVAASYTRLRQAVEAYRSESHTPKLIECVWRDVWQSWGERTDTDFGDVTCDRSQLELIELEKAGRGVVIIPKELEKTARPYQILVETFPLMTAFRPLALYGDDVLTDKSLKSGTYDIETTIDAPNRYTLEGNLEKLLKSQELGGQHLALYIVGSQFSKLTTGSYFDQNGTRSRLLGTRINYWTVDAHFSPEGNLYLNSSLDPEDRSSKIGGRSSGLKRSVFLIAQ